jgi:hypothetical protein
VEWFEIELGAASRLNIFSRRAPDDVISYRASTLKLKKHTYTVLRNLQRQSRDPFLDCGGRFSSLTISVNSCTSKLATFDPLQEQAELWT